MRGIKNRNISFIYYKFSDKALIISAPRCPQFDELICLYDEQLIVKKWSITSRRLILIYKAEYWLKREFRIELLNEQLAVRMTLIPGIKLYT